jgi:hypothetical protein
VRVVVTEALAGDAAIESAVGVERRRPQLDSPKTEAATADVEDAVVHLA